MSPVLWKKTLFSIKIFETYEKIILMFFVIEFFPTVTYYQFLKNY